MGRTSVATDNFDDRTGALGANYASVNNANAGDITINAGHQIEGGSFGNLAIAKWTGAGSFTDDQYASLVLSQGYTGSSNYGAGVMCRITGTTSANVNGYFVYVADVTRLGKVTNGALSTLASSGTPTWAAGDRLELEVEGQSPSITIRVLKNGTALGGSFTVTGDSSFNTGLPGPAMLGDATGLAIGDDLDIGNYSGLVSVAPAPSGAASALAAGIAIADIRPPPPYTLTRVTG